MYWKNLFQDVLMFGRTASGKPTPFRLRRDGRQVTEDLLFVAVTPTISSSPAYDIGDSIGGKMTIPTAVNEANGYLYWESLTICDRGNKKSAMTVLMASSSFTTNGSGGNSTFVDNTAVTINSTDDLLFKQKLSIAAGDWETCGAGGTPRAYATKGNLHLPMRSLDGAFALYAAAISQGTSQYLTTADLVFTFGFSQR